MTSLQWLFRSPPNIPEVKIPEDLAVNVARSLRYEINRGFATLREIGQGHDLKKFLIVCWLLDFVLFRLFLIKGNSCSMHIMCFFLLSGNCRTVDPFRSWDLLQFPHLVLHRWLLFFVNSSPNEYTFQQRSPSFLYCSLYGFVHCAGPVWEVWG